MEELPLEVLLVETDSLTGSTFRGKRNIPAYVEYTAKKVGGGEIKGIPLEQTAAQTKENAMRFFGIK